MRISRREFFQYCTVCATALGLNEATLRQLKAALESDGAPTVIWLHGSGCQGDSVSFLNLFLDAPVVGHRDTKDVLLENINLAYHTVVMASAGDTAVTMAEQAKRKGGYVLVCEGGVPTAFGGKACRVMTVNGGIRAWRKCAGGSKRWNLCIVWRHSRSTPKSNRRNQRSRCTDSRRRYRPYYHKYSRLSRTSRLGCMGCRSTDPGACRASNSAGVG